MRKAIMAALAFLFVCGPAFAAETIVSGPKETTEYWEGKALTARFRVGICYAPDGQARGVLLLRHRNGQEDTYHLYGTLKNSHFTLSHSSGHTFNGELGGPESMKGKARLANGMSLTLSGRRMRNVPVLASDCAPLPQY